MKKYQISAALLVAVILSGCAAKTPYEVFGRNEHGGTGPAVSYQVGVPANPSREDLQNWCNEITASEGKKTAVAIEFVDKTVPGKTEGFCVDGELHLIDVLNQMPGLPSHSQEVPQN